MTSPLFRPALPSLLGAVVLACAQTLPAQVRERFDLPDATVGGDGSFPGTGPAAALAQRPPRGGFVLVEHDVVDGIFGPSATRATKVSSTGIEFDFSPALGVDLVNSAPANGPAGTVNDPSRVDGRPDYGGDPNHSFLEMHACTSWPPSRGPSRQQRARPSSTCARRSSRGCRTTTSTSARRGRSRSRRRADC